jgi:hypothetical protein
VGRYDLWLGRALRQFCALQNTLDRRCLPRPFALSIDESNSYSHITQNPPADQNRHPARTGSMFFLEAPI